LEIEADGLFDIDADLEAEGDADELAEMLADSDAEGVAEGLAEMKAEIELASAIVIDARQVPADIPSVASQILNSYSWGP